MVDIADVIQKVTTIVTYDNIVHWLTPVKYIAIAICTLLTIGIIYFSIFTNYFYLKYFVNMDDYFVWKARKKLQKEKEKEANMPQPLMAKEFKKEDDLFKPEPIVAENDWQKIFNRLESGREIDLKLAIIEADKILNKKFDDMGILGRNLRDKMENLPPEIITTIGNLNSARQVLDDLLKNDQLKMSKETALKTIDIYQKAYINLLS